ncbi:MAG: polysaccharide biosynthesis protein, partial [Candidatus Hydrogenedentales bacterium]
FVLECGEIMQGGEVFVPKIPSMRLADLAEAVAPGCRTRVVGIRPGEKLHEILVSRDESYHAREHETMYVIEPVMPWWRNETPERGIPMEPGTKFSSDANPAWLSPDALRTILSAECPEEFRL